MYLEKARSLYYREEIEEAMLCRINRRDEEAL